MGKVACFACAAVILALTAQAQETGAAPEAVSTTAPATTAPEHPVTVDQVREVLQLIGYSNLKKQIVANTLPYLKQAMPFMPDDVLSDFEGRMATADFEAIIIKSYQAHLSTEDAAQMIAFYKTPAGQHVLTQLPVILKETQLAGAALGQKTMSEVVAAHKTEIEDAARKFQQEQSAPQP